jgi:hypothetical protein
MRAMRGRAGIFGIAALALAGCSAGTRGDARSRVLAESRVTRERLPPPRWSLVAVPRIDLAARPWQAPEGDAGWILGPLRASMEDGVPVVAADSPRAAIVAAGPTAAGWLFVTEDGAAWSAPRFDGPLARLPREAATRMFALPSARAPRAILPVESSDGSLFFADATGIRRAPDALATPVIAAVFLDTRRGVVVDFQGSVFETTDGAQTFSPRSLGADAASDARADGPSLAIRGARGWLTLGLDGVPRPRGPSGASETERPITTESAAVSARAFAVAAALDPARGRAIALVLGGVARADKTVAIVDGDELVLLHPDRGPRRVDAPCPRPRLRPFGTELLVECATDEAPASARFFLGGEQGFAPLGGARPIPSVRPESLHAAADGSAIVLRGPCFGGEREDPAAGCVLDRGRAARPCAIDPRTRVLEVRSGHALLEQPIDDAGRVETRVWNLSSNGPGERLQAPRATTFALAADGAVLSVTHRAVVSTLTRVRRDGTRSSHALPARTARVRDLDGQRMIAWSREPVGHWESDDAGARWTPIEPAIDGRFAVDSPSWTAPSRVTTVVEAPLGRSASIGPACAEFACVIDDDLVYADPRWLSAPPLRAAREGAFARIDPPSESDVPRPSDGGAWRCGSAEAAVEAIRAAHGDAPRDGVAGTRGWLSFTLRDGLSRARWSYLARDAVRTAHARPSRVGEPTTDPSDDGPSGQHMLRLATSELALIERCVGSPPCDLLIARANGPIALLLSGRDIPEGTELHSAEPLASGGLALRFAGGDGRPRAPEASRDVIVTFDRAARVTAWRAHAWRAGHLRDRALAFDGREVGLAVSSRWSPGAFTFFPISGEVERPLPSTLEGAPPCQSPEAAGSSPWMITGDAGRVPRVFVLDRAAVRAPDARARWTVEGGRWCLRDAWPEPIVPARNAPLHARDAALHVRARGGALHAVLLGHHGAHTVECVRP